MKIKITNLFLLFLVLICFNLRLSSQVINPVIFSSYYGGIGEDVITGIANTAKGEIIITGWTSSTNFKTTIGPTIQGAETLPDAFVTKFRIDGSTVELVFSRLIGGESQDHATGIALDRFGNIYITGWTKSSGFPTASAYQSSLKGGSDAFVVKLDSAGEIIYSTYLGGTKDDYSWAIKVNEDGMAYIAGETLSKDFPTSSAYQNKNIGNTDIFVAKFNELGTSIKFSTYLGGSGDDKAFAIDVDSKDAVYITGQTSSSDFPVFPTPSGWWDNSKAYDITYNGGLDAFAAKITGEGIRLEYSTYFGGMADDRGKAVIGDEEGSMWIAGETFKESVERTFPITNVSYSVNHNGGWDCFYAKVDKLKTGSYGRKYQDLLFSTFLGGSGDDFLTAMTKSSELNSIILLGHTKSKNFPTKGDGSLGYNAGMDGFYTLFDLIGSAVQYSTYFGGKSDETPYCLTVDSYKNIYTAGMTNSKDFPMKSLTYQQSNGGGVDGFITKNTFSSINVSTPSGNEKYCTGSQVNIKWVISNLPLNEKYDIELIHKPSGEIYKKIADDYQGESYLWIIGEDITESSDYCIRITHKSGVLNYSTGVFTISNPPLIVNVQSIPGSNVLCEGEQLVLKVNAKGRDLNFQWRLNGTNIQDAKDSIYIIKAVTPVNSGIYDVVVSSACKPDATSSKIDITIKPATEIINDLQDITVFENESVNFSFAARGSALKYRWQKNEVDLSQENAPSFTITSVRLADSGYYRCIVTGDCGVDTTYNAKLTVKKVESVYEGTTNLYDKLNIRIYTKNEDKNYIIIELLSTEYCNLEATLYDMLGIPLKKIYEGPISEGLTTLNSEISGLASGVYWIRFDCGSSKFIKKLLIEN